MADAGTPARRRRPAGAARPGRPAADWQALGEIGRRVTGAEGLLVFRRFRDGSYELAHGTPAPDPRTTARWQAVLPLLRRRLQRRGDGVPRAVPAPVAWVGPVETEDGEDLGALVLVGRAKVGHEDGRLLASALAPALLRTPATGADDLEARLKLRLYRLHTLFDLSRTLSTSFRAGSIVRALATTLMGQLLVSRVGVLSPRRAQGTRLHLFPFDRGERPSRRRIAELPWDDVVAAARGGSARGARAVAAALRPLSLARLYPMEAGGRVVGVVAVSRKTSRTAFSAEDDEFAGTLANHAALALANARLLSEAVEKRRIERELEFARTIQKAILPAAPLRDGDLTACGEAIPCFEVGGDYYDFVRLADGKLLVAAGDVSGKGVPAAILMASVAATVRALAAADPPGPPGSVARLATRINELLHHTTSAARFVSLIIMTIHVESGRVRYVNAGHNPGLHLGRVTRRIDAGGTPLGMFSDATYEEGSFKLAPGDAILLFTDGIAESFTGEHEDPERELAAWARESQDGGAPGLLASVLAKVRHRLGDRPPQDDMTVVSIARSRPTP